MSKFGKFLKGSAKQPTARPAPRPLEEIKKELTNVSYALGQSQYHVAVYTQDVQNKIQRMNELNKEGTERQALDAAAAKESEKAASNE